MPGFRTELIFSPGCSYGSVSHCALRTEYTKPKIIKHKINLDAITLRFQMFISQQFYCNKNFEGTDTVLELIFLDCEL